MGVVAQLFDNVVEPKFRPDDLRTAEALLFAAGEPLEESALAARLPNKCDVPAVMAELQRHYASRGVNLGPDDVKNAIGEMNRAGITTVQSADILKTT